jgi:hypothetical protein
VTRFFSEELSNKHKQERKNFQSGDETVDNYFRTRVSQDVKNNYAKCFVLVEVSTSKIAGFYTLLSSSISLSNLPKDLRKRLPKYKNVPTMLIGWMGRSQCFKQERVGEKLLGDAIRRVTCMDAGVFAIHVDAINKNLITQKAPQ